MRALQMLFKDNAWCFEQGVPLEAFHTLVNPSLPSSVLFFWWDDSMLKCRDSASLLITFLFWFCGKPPLYCSRKGIKITYDIKWGLRTWVWIYLTGPDWSSSHFPHQLCDPGPVIKDLWPAVSIHSPFKKEIAQDILCRQDNECKKGWV